ncbi:N-acetylmuramidase domain-containing protein [Rhizobium alvei]|uniref:N-acetylmuramidase domain-containing protein n=1 Tax=Rhizobium alvei TaxID=1132659 RepID=A0ABT8YTA8_9HYPH|nr:N-acetylmuramidase domain-containing protein [Rhizobium alvei]MDO6967002.1 N-acetylmuramidase domain-containing protein [Rhizobium alvei]
MNFSGTGETLSGDDFARAAASIGCDENAIRAVTAVEARGNGFDSQKRPIILTEPHVFHRVLKAKDRAKLDEAVSLGLAYPVWGTKPYPGTQDARYALLERMMTVDEEAALMACSWGIGQVLGENYKLCGFPSARALVEKCIESEGGQLDVMVAFIKGRGLARHLAAHDWPAFAYGYNGSGYRKNDYDGKLARAYAKYKAGTSIAADPLKDGLLSIGDKGDAVKALQIALGIGADGDFGKLTDQAVKAFQKEHGLLVDGKVGKITGRMLGLTYWN